MARNRQLIKCPPEKVWALLANGYRYDEWVTGTQEITYADPRWPEVDARIHVRVGVGPATMEDICIVRISEPKRRLELEAKAEPFGAARIAIELIPWGSDTLLILDWHPLRGLGTGLHGLPVDYVVKIRNGRMLTKLARIAMRENGSGGDVPHAT